ncbi:uncharacterized protein LOC117627774 isoform X6 [Prunus dulcis]|uniref:uncharacterized protein LOC117627774 isoform X6 n=1 Tax=Prunus dulcis TaxID=3755 RepID=UPI0014834F20|nr:uncharacterized protein LOC117627774 isoform X6 [Prunus dulcis]
MPPSQMKWYLWCCILAGHVWISALSFTSGKYRSTANGSEDWLHNVSSDIIEDFQRSTSTYKVTKLSSLLNDSVSCEDLEGVGSFNTTCLLNSNLNFSSDLYIYGTGNLEILPHVSIVCPIEGCMITFNMSGNVKIGQFAAIVAGSVVFSAANLTMEYNSSINTTSLGGLPPSQTSGTPVGYDGGGGGHGGRGASCLKNNQSSFWGGDVYTWSTLSEPWSYGSKGRGLSTKIPFGGNGGGRVKLQVKDMLYMNGSVTAEGGDGGTTGGGGSGGSISVHAVKLKGYGTISAAGGRGWGGGGGGRLSLDCYSIQEDVKVTVHGGLSIGCPGNAGAAGTYFNADLLSLRVGNDNITTETETPLLDFPTSPLWSHVFVENNAKVLVPLLWTRVQVGAGSLLQAPLDDDASRNVVTKSLCESQACPLDLITPPDDCHVNYTLSFSLQICRVEDLLVDGVVEGSVIHIHRARTIIVDNNGLITASELGCSKGIGSGNFSNGAGSGAGHGGRGGSGYFNGRVCNGGNEYGNADLPCELGSGAEGPSPSYGNVVGGGMIVMGSIQWPLLKLDVFGTLSADGQSFHKAARNGNGTLIGGLGGGSGGTILIFLQELGLLAQNSSLSVAGGKGGPLGGGGGGGGRVHFHWSKIDFEDEYVPVASISGSINSSGGAGDDGGHHGSDGTVTGKKCPKGLYGTFCKECPVGTFKNVDGSDAHLCIPCSVDLLPSRAEFIYVRGGVTQPSCPYKCVSDNYRMPKCYTPLEELLYTFGGPWPFAILLSCVLVVLALLLRTLRIKLVGSCSYHRAGSIEQHSHHQFPCLLSLSEVRGTRVEETQSHVHRMYFMGPNTFREPWHLPYSPPNAIIEIVYEDAFNRFIDEINSVAAYDWWEGSVHSILSVLAYPCSWSWKQWRQRNKVHRLQEYVKSEYDHSCLRSCRSRALYKGMKVGATPDLMLAYIDFFLGGDEKRLDMVSIIQKRFPMCIIFGGDGSYMSPYNLHNDTLLTNLLGQHVPETVWNHLVAGLNAQLRMVRHGSIRSHLIPVINWINSHANPQLVFHGVRVELGWFQATASGYYQLGILVVVGDYPLQSLHQSDMGDNELPRSNAACTRKCSKQMQQNWPFVGHALSVKRITGGINGGLINHTTLRSLDYKRDFLFPLSLLLHNTRPVGRQDTLLLLISFMLLADLSVTILMLLEFYWISLGAFLAVLLILPLSLLSPFLAGLNALFSKELRRASLARVYALWNATSLSNIVVAFMCGILHYGFSFFQPPQKSNTWNTRRDDDKWWLLPSILLLFKLMQALFVDWHIANLEIQDHSLFFPDPDAFWAHESGT